MDKDNNKGLTRDQLKRFHQDGYLGPLPRFADVELIQDVLTQVRGIIQSPKPHPLYGRYSVRDWHLVSEDIKELSTNSALIASLESLIGVDLALWRSKIFHKKPGENGTGWHQEWGDFDGEEIGNNKPSLRPAQERRDCWWNLTVWVALTDVELDCAPLRFIRGSHKKQYPKTMVPMTESEFWHDPFIDCKTIEDLVERANNDTLVLDVDTSGLFESYQISGKSFDDVKAYVRSEFEKLPAKKTLGVDESQEDIVTLPMKKGEYVIFTERTMHGSLPNTSTNDRFAINFRVTTTDTEIYPFRHLGDFIDGSNIDIAEHSSLLISGRDLSKARNNYT
ncbi:phytanoyl-CoA dioxygenase family protein [Vibrio profundi]|uniref:phytanoyl-CoA dioxygenase family protein n=1 Tax=Vibrio profundi TaxID=1774960 RepID=UPI003736D5B8